jgi:ribosomal protein S18 acetylase RimI-like enzyme
MSWSLDAAVEADIDELMTWFPDSHSVSIWGGPGFRYPFDRESFQTDCRWRDFASFCLRNQNGEVAAFGQLGSRYARAHLARLVANPNMRRQGVGRKLIEMMISVASGENQFSEIALFVLRDNVPAFQCYRSLGFDKKNYPDDAPMRDLCFYMTRPIV